ncbi:hypothetical protein PHMEG_00017711 [Phytophthora megakarya]|uniref:Reverse transcriptase n=1 Tax=Phytophthora megakarya TaxID=4795 RepID=A0A225VVW0_9STRA|nr:hypothetical protein PHMEG_00017711 [Phytophthora megakarya]
MATNHGTVGRDRTVIDAALLLTPLTERAAPTKGRLIMTSKDCLKCFDRIPRWYMNLIYRGIGVPELPRNHLIDPLGPGIIDVRTAFGWLSTGEREFGIGQGSILSNPHVSCYMDYLQARLVGCAHTIEVQYHQTTRGRVWIGSTLFDDDQLGITSTEQGAQEHTNITNMLTGEQVSLDKFKLYLHQKDSNT